MTHASNPQHLPPEKSAREYEAKVCAEAAKADAEIAALKAKLAEAVEVLTYYACEPEDRIYDMGRMADKWLERNRLGEYAPSQEAP